MPDWVIDDRAADFDPSLGLSDRLLSRGSEWVSVPFRRRLASAEIEPDPPKAHVALLDGVEVFEGDIDVTPLKSRPVSTWGLITRQGHETWPSGVIHAVAQPAVRNLVAAAIQHWMQHTPLRFVDGTSDDYLVFEDRGICRSRVGRRGGPQLVELNARCTVGDVVHEIGHAIGLWHEHSRSDRDRHIRVLEENVEPGQSYNFAVHDGSAQEHGTYDLRSIMHYESLALSERGQPTIVTRVGERLPPRSGLSSGDLAAVRALYPNSNW